MQALRRAKDLQYRPRRGDARGHARVRSPRAGAERRGRRLRRLVPTASLFAWHRRRCEHFFAAAAKVMPEHADALAALDAPEFLKRFLRHLADSHVAGFHYVEHVQQIRLFYERSAGGATLMSIALAGASDDGFPPSRPVSISLSAVARDFAVSRVHVRRLVQERSARSCCNGSVRAATSCASRRALRTRSAGSPPPT